MTENVMPAAFGCGLSVAFGVSMARLRLIARGDASAIDLSTVADCHMAITRR
jgi:hypothetical protein